MAQAGYTPISLYYSTTASAQPTSGNLVAGELALNTLDEKLYFKNSAGTVKLLASSASTTNVQTISFGSTGLTPSTATSGAVTVAGTLAVGNGGTGTSTAFTTGSVVFAGASGIYTQDNANFFWDDTNNRLGIGTSSPSGKVDVYDATNSLMQIAGDTATELKVSVSRNAATSSTLSLRKTRGTNASPTAVSSADSLGKIFWQAYGGTNNRNIASIEGAVDTYTSDTDISSNLRFSTSPSGSVTATERMRIFSSGGVSIGNATDPGNTNLSVTGSLTLGTALTVANGGTGIASATAYALLAGGTTTTGPLQSIASVGTAGQVLTSNGAGALPTFQAASGGVTTISFGSTGLTPSTATSGAVSVAGTLAVANGGTGLTTTPTNGQLDIGNGSGFTRATLTGTSNQVVVTNGAGSITLSTPQSIGTASSVQFGSFGVGTAASGTSGEIRATNNVTAYYSSDKRLKENIKDVENALEKVCIIGSKTFDWTDDYIKEHGGEDNYFMQKSDFGVIAQDVQTVFPQAVRTRDDGTLAVDYEKLSTLAFGAIKELVKRIEILETK